MGTWADWKNLIVTGVPQGCPHLQKQCLGGVQSRVRGADSALSILQDLHAHMASLEDRAGSRQDRPTPGRFYGTYSNGALYAFHD